MAISETGVSRDYTDLASLCRDDSVITYDLKWVTLFSQSPSQSDPQQFFVFKFACLLVMEGQLIIYIFVYIIYSELLSQTSQQLTTDLAERKQHYCSLFGLLQVIPPELQQLQNSICEILYFVPTIDLLASEIQQVKNGIWQLQRHNNGQYFTFPFLGFEDLQKQYIQLLAFKPFNNGYHHLSLKRGITIFNLLGSPIPESGFWRREHIRHGSVRSPVEFCKTESFVFMECRVPGRLTLRKFLFSFFFVSRKLLVQI